MHVRFSRWSKSGVWQRLFTRWAQEADNEWVMIDSTVVRAHPHSAGAIKEESEVSQAIGRNRGGLRGCELFGGHVAKKFNVVAAEFFVERPIELMVWLTETLEQRRARSNSGIDELLPLKATG